MEYIRRYEIKHDYIWRINVGMFIVQQLCYICNNDINRTECGRIMALNYVYNIYYCFVTTWVCFRYQL